MIRGARNSRHEAVVRLHLCGPGGSESDLEVIVDTGNVLALDLERTLVSDAISGEPRPGLFNFLAFCLEQFDRVALFTSVETADARDVLESLAGSGHVPPAFLARVEYVDWAGEFKDLRFVPGATPDEVLLVDDDGGWVRPDQRDRWVPVVPWDGGPDDELPRVRAALERRLAEGIPPAAGPATS
jgi:hypothetical protein